MLLATYAPALPLQVGSDASKIKADCQHHCDDAQALMGVDNLGGQLIFYRLVLPTKNIDKSVTPAGAQENTKALSKALYGKMFEWLFKGVANVVLASISAVCYFDV